MDLAPPSDIFDFLHFQTPTTEQRAALSALQDFVQEDDKRDFFILCGAAGTGKTSLVSALTGYLNSRKQGYRIAAPTGRAARILSRKAGSTAGTVHSMIYLAKSDPKTGRVNLKLKTAHFEKPVLFIIDEASMISTKNQPADGLFSAPRSLLFDLIEYIKKANASNKILFLGDRYQLPPIMEEEALALRQDYIEENFNLKGQSHWLTEVKRQSDGSYILENATDIRKAIDAGKQKHPIMGKQANSIYTAAADYVKEAEREGPGHAISLAVSHKANAFFNSLVREKMFGKANQLLETGDLLISLTNWNRNGAEIHNGDHVQLIEVDWSLQEQVAGLHFVAVQVKPLFEGEDTIIEDYLLVETLMYPGGKLSPDPIAHSQLENGLRQERNTKNPQYRESGNPADDRYVGALRLAYGHAITCNKAQGGEWKKVYINTFGIPNLKWQYTAVTRAQEEVERFGPNQ